MNNKYTMSKASNIACGVITVYKGTGTYCYTQYNKRDVTVAESTTKTRKINDACIQYQTPVIAYLCRSFWCPSSTNSDGSTKYA